IVIINMDYLLHIEAYSFDCIPRIYLFTSKQRGPLHIEGTCRESSQMTLYLQT
ncbi:hypothetical protein ACJX0J_021366, partial [Zea mays]